MTNPFHNSSDKNYFKCFFDFKSEAKNVRNEKNQNIYENHRTVALCSKFFIEFKLRLHSMSKKFVKTLKINTYKQNVYLDYI